MRMLLGGSALALLALLATAAPAAAWLAPDDDCRTVAAIFGDPYVEDIGRLAVADLDGDGAPDSVCGKTWDEGASQAERVHEACHTVQQGAGAPQARAVCDGPGAWVQTAEEYRTNIAKSCAALTGGLPQSPPCSAVRLRGEGVLHSAAAACAELPDQAAADACGMTTATIRARHEAAMNSIRNMKA